MTDAIRRIERRDEHSNKTGQADLRVLAGGYTASTLVLTALGLALRARLDGRPLSPELNDAVESVLAQTALPQAIRTLTDDELTPIFSLVKAELMFAAQLLSEETSADVWRARPPEVLQSFGRVSAGFPALLDRLILPQAPDLARRLTRPGVHLLDVGTGVGWLSIGMLQRWPTLTVTGVEPVPEALALAQDNLVSSGLAARMRLFAGRGEDITDEGMYDLAFVPSAFIQAEAMPKILARVRQALRPGGWLLLAVVEPPEDALAGSLARFRAAAWGGSPLGIGGGRSLMTDAGFIELRVHRQASGYIAFLTGRAWTC